MSQVLNGLALFAGTLVTCAALPRVWDVVRHPSKARGESVARNAMMVVGNLMWTIYGVAGSIPAIATMCGISVGLNAFILLTAVRVRRNCSRWAE